MLTDSYKWDTKKWLNSFLTAIVQVYNCYGYQFCLHFEAFNLGMVPVYMAFIHFMGDDHDTRKFSYSLEIGGNGKKMTRQGVPRSIRDGHAKVCESMGRLIIQQSMALLFSGGNRQELKLKVAGRRVVVLRRLPCRRHIHAVM